MMNGKEHDVRGRIIRGILVILVGVIIWFLPIPAGVKKEAWHLLAIFVATIFGLILSPLPMGAVVIIGVVMTLITGVLKIGPALSGFANNTVWLIVAAFLVARGFITTGLGTQNLLHVHPGLRPQNPGAGLCDRGQRPGPFAGHPLEYGKGRGNHLSDRPVALQYLRV